MIFDKIENLKLYSAMCEGFELIEKFIAENDMKSLPCESYEVGGGIKVSLAEYEPGAGGEFEAHREFNDLQYAITGGETIEVIPLACAKDSGGYEPDIEFFASQTCESTKVSLEEGTFAFLAPGDAHRPGVKLNSEKIKKAVFKIPV